MHTFSYLTEYVYCVYDGCHIFSLIVNFYSFSDIRRVIVGGGFFFFCKSRFSGGGGTKVLKSNFCLSVVSKQNASSSSSNVVPGLEQGHCQPCPSYLSHALSMGHGDTRLS